MIDPMEAIKTWEYKMLPLEPLDDKSIRTLCVGDPRFNQQDLRDVILAHGEVETIEMGGLSSGCVVVTYTTREGAEKAMKELLNKLVKGMRPRVIWLPIPQHDARPHSLRNSFKNSSDAIQHARNPYQLMRTRVKPPNDKSIRVLYVRELFGRIEEKELRDVISAADGEIESIEMEPSADCAVVTYTTREGAEKAAKELLAKRVKCMRLKVSWYIPEPIQPNPFPTTQFSNLQIQPNIPIQRTKPYYNKNNAPICIKYSLGDRCRKGDDCPYRHEGPVMIDPMEAIKKWEYMMLPLEPQDDKSNRTLIVGDLRFNEQDIRDVILAHGEIETIKMGPTPGCVVVTYTTREGAEKAMKELFNKLVNGMRLGVMWYTIAQTGSPYQPIQSENEYRHYEMLPLEPLDDKSIRTLCVGDPRFNQQDLRDVILAHGEVETIEMGGLSSGCVVVTYTTREGAEKAMKELLNKLVKGMRPRVIWLPIPQHDARPHLLRNSFKNSSDAIQHARNPYQLMPTRVKPPNDKSILYVRELFGRIEEKELRDVISSAADGEIESIEMEPSADCAVVTYTTREGAEKAAKELLAKRVKGMRLKVSWYIPEPIQAPHPIFPTTQFSNLQIQPNIPTHPPCSIPQPEPYP